ncbi:MAG: DUF1858 domain-containing protein [Erysipelothrix sp.]|nr:DUF1858 domain-containing protein [Erysipelothrix sp.]
MKMISIDEKVLNVINDNPDLVEPLVELGFTHLGNPQMLQVVGKVMTIRKAAKNHRVPLSEIKEKLNAYGFDIEEEIKE